MTYSANNLPPPNGPQFEAPAGAKPDPDRSRAQYIRAKALRAGDRIFVTHSTGSTQFEVTREVESIDVDTRIGKVTITFKPKRGAAVTLPNVDAEQSFRAFELVKRE